MKLVISEACSLRVIPNVLLVSLIVWITLTEVSNGATEHVCRGMDIRNRVKEFEKLNGCTVIEGSLQILLIDYAEPSDYVNLSFPLLREITDYFLLYRVYNLRSLATIFPNLSVIRGQRLFFNYALVAFEMMSLEDVALPSLTTILRGAVRLEKNSNLCYIDTIDWSRIARNATHEDNFILQNKGIDKCVNHCPRNKNDEELCPTKAKAALCWNSNHCQLVCPQTCGNKACYTDSAGLQCCDDECIGGCTGPTDRDCAACTHFFFYDKCVSRCPPGTYVFSERRCITETECKDMMISRYEKMKLYYNKEKKRDECVEECPSGFTVDEQDTNKCKPCDGPCPRTCIPVPVDSVAAAQKLKGCTVIQGFLQIHITGGNRVGYELDQNLGQIQIVTQYIKVIRSPALYSLHFLRQLRIIKGDEVYNERYALFVLDNQNLQEIWDWKFHPNLTIIKGLVFFNQNRKLCLNKIYELVDKVGLMGKVDEVDISRINNGDQAACNMTSLQLTVVSKQSTVVIVKWSSFKADDERKLLHYVVYYREAPEQNITIWNARDACSTDIWKTRDVPVPQGGERDEDIAEIVYDLKPYTQYAMYVQTYTIASAQQGAISPIIYFTTKPDLPTNPRKVEVEAKSAKELLVTWEPPGKPNGNVTHYYVYWQAQPLSQEKLDQRNYCIDKLHLPSLNEKEEEEEVKSNITYDGKHCCQCPMSEKEAIASENDRRFQIMFEDFLHDTVYVKRPTNMKENPAGPEEIEGEAIGSTTLPARYRRELNMPSSYLQGLDGRNSSSILSNLSLPNVTNTTDNMYDDHEGHPPYLAAVVYGKTMIVLPNLLHFTEYSIEVIACHEFEQGEDEKRCSNRAITTGRTLPLVGVDNVDHNNITIDVKQTDVLLIWPDPPDPNGLMVTYEIKYQQIGKDFKPMEKCIPHKQYREIGGYKISSLNEGNYSLSIRATSLAGNGSWTQPKYFFVTPRTAPPGLKMELIAGVAACCAVIAVILVSMLIWYYAKKHFNTPNHIDYASFNPDYHSTYIRDEWEVKREDVTIGRELGQGSFGMVYEGLAKNLISGKEEIKVAIKTVMEGATQRDRMEFLNEASVMKAFNCNHVVKLLGVVSDGAPTLVIMELMANGDLKNYLRMHRPDAEDNNGRRPPTLKEILKIAGEICDGMVYLSSKKFVHRDLAARNCMVAEDTTVKIGDFGMTRDVYETDYYRKGGKGLLPVRWMAPESLKDGRFTSQSDVWSFGVVLWEMATLATQPYQGLSNEQVLNYVKDGGIMERPVGCPDRLYEIMLDCWRHSPRERPTFCEILESLVPDLDESFKDVAYFFSEENQHEREQAKAKQERQVVIQTEPMQEEDLPSDSESEEEDGYKGMNDSHTPLTGSKQDLNRHQDHPPAEPLRLYRDTKPSLYPSHLSSSLSSSYSGVPSTISSHPLSQMSSSKPYQPHLSSAPHCPPTDSGHKPPHSSPHSNRTVPSLSGPTLPSPPSPSGKPDMVSRSPSTDDSKDSSKSSGGSGYAPVNGMANGHLPRPYVPRQAKC